MDIAEKVFQVRGQRSQQTKCILCPRRCSVEADLLLTLLDCWQGVDGKYIQALPLSDRHAPREFHIDESVGMLSSTVLQLFVLQ